MQFLDRKKDSNLLIYAIHSLCQWCKSMIFWCRSGSGSADPCLWLMDPDSDPVPSIFIIDLQDASRNKFLGSFFWILLFDGTFKSFIKGKKSKRSHKAVYSRFILLFLLNDIRNCIRYLWMTDPDQGGPKTRGSGGSGCATLFFLLADLRKISFFFEMEFLNSIFSRGYWAYSQVLSGFLPFCKILIMNRLDFWSRDSFFCEYYS